MNIQSISTVSYNPVFKQKKCVSFCGVTALKTDKFVKSKPAQSGLNGFLSAVASMVQTGKKALKTEDVNALFIENGFKKNARGQFFKKLTSAQEAQIDKVYGDLSGKVKDYFQPTGQEIQKDFKEFLEIGNNYSLAKKNFNEMFILFSNMNENVANYGAVKEILKENPKYLQLVQNLAINPPKTASVIDAINNYKRMDYTNINDALRNKGAKPKADIASEIKSISSFMDTQIIKNPVNLYRGEGYEILDNVTLSNGKKVNLGAAMREAARTKDAKKINKIREFVLDNDIKAYQPSFMSTSIDKNIGKDFANPYSGEKKIVWELTTKPNTKGFYMEPLVFNSKLGSENEVLLQKGSEIKIKDCSFKDGQWFIKGEVSNS